MRRSGWFQVSIAGVTFVCAVVALVASRPALVAQTPSVGAARTARPYAPPRTPWGDPDLQGDYTNKFEQSTPFERPEGFEGRRAQDVVGAELAVILEKRNRDVLTRPAAVGPYEFRDNLDVTRGSRAWLVIDPPDGRIPLLTPEGRKRMAPAESPLDAVNARRRGASSFGSGPFNGPEDFSLFDRCITRGLPGSMIPFLHGNSYTIVQAPGLVAIRYEIMHETRVIPLDGRVHTSRAIPLDMGDARGHWDGDALVVETTNFTERSAYRDADAGTLRIVERFTPTSLRTIEWAVTVDDPKTWTRPWTFAMPLTKDPSEAVLEFACHEGNTAVANILRGARAAERVAGPVAAPAR